LRLRKRTELAEEARRGEAVAAEPVGGEPVSRQLAGPSAGAASARGRRGIASRTRDAGASAVGTASAGVLLFARLVMLAATLVAVLIALAIVLRDVDANPSNTIVKGIHEGASFFAGAFTGLIRFNGHPKRAITVDWGIALLVFLIVGEAVSRAIAGVGRGGLMLERSHRAAAPTA
jgi:hypothetical protein